MNIYLYFMIYIKYVRRNSLIELKSVNLEIENNKTNKTLFERYDEILKTPII